MRKDKNCFIYRRNSYYHLYNRGNRKENIFKREKDYEVFKNLLYKYIRKYGLHLMAYCFMPNHYHLILKCGADASSITRFMRSFMVAYAMYFNRKHNKVGHLFQGPFQVRRLQGIKDLETVKNYLKNNPLEAELIGGEEIESYRWLYINSERVMNGDQF